MKVVEELLAEAGSEPIELLFPYLGTPALLDAVGSLPLDAPDEAVERCVDESLKDVCKLHS